MRAVRVARLEGPDSVEVVDIAEPANRQDQVVIETHASGVTFPDVLLTRGEYQLKPETPFVPGSEVAGVVRRAPEGSAVKAGDRVAAFTGFGGFAETAVAESYAVFPLPESVSFEAGAALPMNYFTVDFALRRRGALRSGETVLVHGAAGGVGTAAIQVAKAMGAKVIAVTSTKDKAAVALDAGADEAVLVDGFKDATRTLTAGEGVDVVVDPVGGDRFTDSLRSLAPEGRLLVVGFTGRDIPLVKVNRLLLNNVSVVGVGWGAFWTRNPAYLQEQWAFLLPLLESGRIDPPIGSRYPLTAAAEALKELDERRASGKVLIQLK
ncbi:MAG TPA: NADPH:quinone oxidoreductase family protein [Acidimicrobiales bacterium]|nr:NADPH:quinone oxidoreductase family protein [Acidimicrobiales bacterium]